MKLHNLILPFLLLSVISLIIWRHFIKNDERPVTQKRTVEYTIQLAGNNKYELEKVLEHFKDDSLKLEAARFLIRNMQNCYSHDTTNLAKYRPILYEYNSLIQLQKKNTDLNINEIINNKWDSIKSINSLYQNIHSSPLIMDITHLSSDFLIENINRTFDSWENNPHSDSIDFLNFCEYVLPYRRKNGMSIENLRKKFKSKHFIDIKKSTNKSIKNIFDSLMFQYKDIRFSGRLLSDYPYFKTSDLMISERGLCIDIGILNSSLFSSLGYPVTIDYVPAWGNRSNKHSWNVLLLKNNSYAFEPFWQSHGQWIDKKKYNNSNLQNYWGKYRLPKVFRHTFSSHDEGPAIDPRVPLMNIPTDFLNLKRKDVSEEYFCTSNVTINLKQKIPKNTYYGYLCIYDGDGWHPIHWGLINNKNITFTKMGRDIVYLPTYCKKGELIPIDNAFILQKNGQIKYLKPTKNLSSVTLTRKHFSKPYLEECCKDLINGTFEIGYDSGFIANEEIFRITEQLKEHPNIFKLKKSYHTRYGRFILPIQKDNLAEIYFFTTNNNSLHELKGKPICSDTSDTKIMNKALDGDVLTYVDINRINNDHKKLPKHWIGLDFGRKVKIDALGICPRNDKNHIYPGLNYELFYWDKQWVSLGVKKASRYQLTYENTPQNALLLLKCLDEGKEIRIFTYENNNQVWW